MTLTSDQFERYRRQLNLPGMSAAAQERLLAGTACIIGANSCANHAVRFLNEIGFGTVTVLDSDEAALFRALAVSKNGNKDSKLNSRVWRFDSGEAEAVFAGVDVVLDALDNWQHKLAASDLCMQLRKPLIHAGGDGFRFQVYTMLPGKSACLRCVLPEVGMDDVPLTATETSSLAPVCGMIGALQAIEAIKIVAKLGATQGNELWKFDWLSGEFETVRGLDPHFDCPDCGRYARNPNA